MKLIDMKKLATLTLALFVFAGTAYGQGTSDDATASASVNVVSTISVTSAQNPSFGTVAQGAGQVTLDPTDGTTDNGGGNPQAGTFTIEGTGGQGVQLSFPSSVELTGSGDPITFNTNVTGTSSSGSQGGSTNKNDGDSVTLNGSGKYFLYVGGNINVGSSQATGTYDGDFTLTAEYTGI